MTRTLLYVFGRERLPLIGLSFAVLFVSTLIGTFMPVDPELAKQIEEAYKQFEQYGPSVILLNNAFASIIMMVPLLGLGSAVYVAYTTGIALASVSSLAGIDPRLSFMFTFLMPHSILEFLAYSLALSENLAICQRILTRKELDKELRYLLATLIMVTIILTIGALVETATINVLGAGS